MEFNPRIFFIFIIVNVLISQLSALECYTSRGEYGECVEIRNCPIILKLVAMSPLPPEDKQYLQQSKCPIRGKSSTDVIICCPTYPRRFHPDFNPRIHPLLPANCGEHSADRIVGGEVAEIDEFPWMALLEYQTPNGIMTACGGVLINKRYVLTAAHCLKNIRQTWTLVNVRLGEYDTTQNPDCIDIPLTTFCADPVVTIPIEKKIIHEDYNRSNRNRRNDIALLRLTQDVQFTNYIQPICLPQSSNIEQLLHTAGWGATENRTPSKIKLKLTIPLTKDENCIPYYRNSRIHLGFGQFCAGGQMNKDTCQGDSGGPVMTRSWGLNETNPKWVAVGLVSFGSSTCGSTLPSVYTKVHDFLPWILRNLKP